MEEDDESGPVAEIGSLCKAGLCQRFFGLAEHDSEKRFGPSYCGQVRPHLDIQVSGGGIVWSFGFEAEEGSESRAGQSLPEPFHHG